MVFVIIVVYGVGFDDDIVVGHFVVGVFIEVYFSVGGCSNFEIDICVYIYGIFIMVVNICSDDEIVC